ncbi:MAG: S41 family peptidase [Flavobacteriales bacterium]|nr:S41 family peptidase [Flavobacteriales bacterium]MBK6892014.1 S41 family peptidase [Flavobacteriales bacterium]MBK7246152.1 S41 family peptidase [Flavobacteriales bacterium]MBK7286280.1 S41 family peptidase [Flavobacteriales bacterium]QQS71853.1 MAG: S41 family peptidase [Flavobacteriales bacterium]
MNGTDDKKRSWAVFYPLMLGVAVAGGFYVGSRMGGSEVPTSRLFELRKNNPGAKLQQVLDLIERQYVDTVQKGKLVDAVLQNMLQQLDPHSYYISAADLQAAEEPLEGSFMGIGVEFSIQRDTIIVVATIEGGPSEALGIRAGDRIVNADSVKLAGVGVTNDMVMKALRGPENTKVTVGIVRGGGKPFDVTITRGPIPINSVAVSLLDDDSTGYVKLSRFARTTHEEFVKATSELKALGMKRLILDLRGNGGGYLNAAIGVCDELLPKGSGIVYTEGRASPRQDYKADGDGTLIDMPLAVLIDEGSASASEIVTGAVQDNDRALIVGRRSFGKGLVQEQINLRDNSAVRITTARYYTPSGRCIQRPYGNGIDYNDDLEERYIHGELLNIDSIHLDSSKAYSTKDGRTVYGGGGIMPDIFVPADTTDRSAYLSELFFSGALNRYSFDVADRHRAALKKFGGPERFNKQYAITTAQLEALAKEAESQGVKYDPEDLKASASIIALRLKAGVARNIWGDSGYYRVLLSEDRIYDRAHQVLRAGQVAIAH